MQSTPPSRQNSHPPAYCPCGDRLWTRAELLAEDDELARHIAVAYLNDDSAYCADEDDVVPRAYWKQAGTR
jgi:hypothetical protein